MKKTIILLALVCFFAGCSSANKESAPSQITSSAPTTKAKESTPSWTYTPTKATTSRGTPIVDEDYFDVNNVYMYSVDSTCFSEVGYDRDSENLVVTFRDSGATYVYTDFPMYEWDSFFNASSLGRYYNSHIKGYFPCYKVE
ncbi:MAG: KTSC domain-containing protein [Lachnospiraceae bacterium]|nr:KTSC domain-containing protein [Lachnospiraceae bacterium]